MPGINRDGLIKVGLVGAGFMGKALALQIVSSSPGIELAAISNRHPKEALEAYSAAGVSGVVAAGSTAKLEDAISYHRPVVTDDFRLLCRAGNIDVIVEATGSVEFGAIVALEAIGNGKHFITMSSELDGTLGPILRVHSSKAGVVMSGMDGDQPGVIMNLYRYVRCIGAEPVLCGNIKGFHDRYRNPTTQEGFARRWGQDPRMVTSFADGTKVSFEQAVVANATSMRVWERGMMGPVVPVGTPIREAIYRYPLEEISEAGGGVVDYVVGADPAPGVFVVGAYRHSMQRKYLEYYKMGTGPFYCYYVPYHLCHFEVPFTIMRAVLFSDASVGSIGPFVDVVTAAKLDLKSGEVLDGIGGYKTFGVCENYTEARSENLLPIGLVAGCRLRNDVKRDQILTYADVEVPLGRSCDRLRAEQDVYFSGERR